MIDEEKNGHSMYDETIYGRPTLRCRKHGRYYEKYDDCPDCMTDYGNWKPQYSEVWRCTTYGCRHGNYPDEEYCVCGMKNPNYRKRGGKNV